MSSAPSGDCHTEIGLSWLAICHPTHRAAPAPRLQLIRVRRIVPVVAPDRAGASVGVGLRRLVRTGLPQLTRYRLVLGGVLVLTLAFYMWTAATSAPFDFTPGSSDPYNELTSGFVHGHTYVPITPPPALLRLADPYDPAQNSLLASPYHDYVLYGGHFYLTWGPTPVVTLFAPFRLTGYWMSESFAVALFGFVGLVCAVALLHLLVALLVPGTRRWVLLAGTVCLALTNVVPFILRRPAQYEVAISCGYCFEMAGLLLCVWALRRDRVDRLSLALGSLCLGLAVGGRPTLVFGGLAAYGIALWTIRWRRESPRILIAALGPFVLCMLLLAAYNAQRFGAISEFGAKYALTGYKQTEADYYNLKWLLPGLASYLLLPARLALTFPHAFLMTSTSLPFRLPAGYEGSISYPYAEPTGGILPTMPIVLFLAALPVIWRQRREGERGAVAAAAGMVALGTSILVALAYGIFGTTQRYEVDFVSLLLIPALLVWAVLLARYPRRAIGRRMIASVGVAFIAFGAFIGTAVSTTGYLNLLDVEHPTVFQALEDLTSPLVTVATMISGTPEIVRVDSPALATAGYTSLNGSGAGVWLGAYPALVGIVSPGNRRVWLVTPVARGPGAPPVAKLDIIVSGAGAPYMVRLTAGTARLPLRLHLGLNRFDLTLAGLPPGSAVNPNELLLERLELSP